MPQDLTDLYKMAAIKQAKLKALDARIGPSQDPDYIGYEEFFASPPDEGMLIEGPPKQFAGQQPPGKRGPKRRGQPVQDYGPSIMYKTEYSPSTGFNLGEGYLRYDDLPESMRQYAPKRDSRGIAAGVHRDSLTDNEKMWLIKKGYVDKSFFGL